VGLHQFCFKLGKFAIGTVEILKVDLEGQQLEGLEFLSVFASSEVVWFQLRMLNAGDLH
jgi:hypothetical protein